MTAKCCTERRRAAQNGAGAEGTEASDAVAKNESYFYYTCQTGTDSRTTTPHACCPPQDHLLPASRPPDARLDLHNRKPPLLPALGPTLKRALQLMQCVLGHFGADLHNVTGGAR